MNRLTASNFGLVIAAIRRESFPPSLYKTLTGGYKPKQGVMVNIRKFRFVCKVWLSFSKKNT